MSIASELENLQQDITNARTVVTNKGGTITTGGGSSQLATDIATIPTGVTPTGNIPLTASTTTQTGIDVTNYATASVAPTPSETKTLTLGSSAPTTVTPTSGKYLSSVPVSLDTSVIKAENIAQDVTILGITGTHSGGGGTKYGASIESLLGDVNASGVYQFPTTVSDFTFTGVKSLPAYAFYYKFYNYQSIGDVSFPDLTTISGNYALSYAFHGTNIQSFTANNLTTLQASAFTYAFANLTSTNFKAYFNGITSITSNSAFSNAFYESSATEIEFNNLETISASSAFNTAFRDSSNQLYNDKVWHIMPKLKTINGASNFSSAFQYIKTKRMVFDSLESIGATNNSTYTTFQTAFTYATMKDNDDIDKQGLFFPALKTIGKASTSSRANFQGIFTNSNNRHSMHFYELETVYNTNSSSSYGQFSTNNAVRVYMPKVTDLGTYNKNNFYGSTLTLQIHFGKENQATIEAMSGYGDRFGATNATIYFDMINHITVNSVVYDRDGAKCDLDNWYFAYTDANDNTIYVTNHNDPAVGDTVYTQSGTAGSYTYTAVGTIEAVA